MDLQGDEIRKDEKRESREAEPEQELNKRTMAKQHSRTRNTIYNFTTSIGGQLVTTAMQFVVRTVFINTLGKSYLGIGGLFSNILSMLSLTEFGVGTAILFKLYDPIARHDHHRVAVLMKFYKTVYRGIGLVIALLGAAVIPLLPYLIKDFGKLQGLGLNAGLIFGIYLLKTVSSYLFFAYKSAIIKADQKQYLINLVSYLFTIGGAVAQILCLVLYPKFEIYVMISVLEVIVQNVVVAIMANRMYPFINEQTEDQLEKKEILEIFKDCGALFLYKLNTVVLKATDNIVISSFIGLEMVGMYSNYHVLYTTIHTMFSRIFNAVGHSLGNLHTTHDLKHEYEVFEIVNLVTAILGGTAFVGLFCVSDELVTQWVGKEWVIAPPFSLLIGLEVYTLASRVALARYRTTMGLFQQAKWRPVAGMLINLIVSVLLVNVWGICGVLVGTLAAEWLVFMWFDPLIIHKYGFQNYKNVSSYYRRLVLYTVTSLAVGGVDWLICRHFFTGHGWFSVIVHMIICGVTTPAALIGIMYKRQEGQYMIKMVRRSWKKTLKRLRGKSRGGQEGRRE